MAIDYYKDKIKFNGENAENKFTTNLRILDKDIASLRNVVSSTINNEVNRLIPENEKKRVMINYRDDLVGKMVRELNASKYFKIIRTKVQDFPNSRDIALGKIKQGDLTIPASFNPTMPDKDRIESYYDSLSVSDQEEYVFNGISEQEKIATIKSKPEIFFDALREDDKLFFIAQYSSREDEEEGSRQKFNKKLKESQERKDKLKNEIVNRINSVISSMKKTIADNEKLIVEFQNIIYKKELELIELKEKPIDTNSSLNTIQKKQEAIAGLVSSITELKDDLKNAEAEQRRIVDSLIKHEQDLLDIKKMPELLSGGLESSEEDSSNRNILPDAATEKFGPVATGNSQLSQKEKAKTGLENLINGKDSKDVRMMLNQYSYDRLVAEAHQLRGPINKFKLNRFYNIVLEDMAKTDTDIDMLLSNDCGIHLTDLKDMTKLETDKIEKIQDLLTKLNDNYRTISETEKNKINLIMNYIKIGMLKKETENFKRIKNLFDGGKRQRLTMLTTQLKKHAKNVYDEKSGIIDRYNSFRESMHIEKVDKSKIIETQKAPNVNEIDQNIL